MILWILRLHDNFFAHFRDKKGIQNIESPNFLTGFNHEIGFKHFRDKQYQDKYLNFLTGF